MTDREKVTAVAKAVMQWHRGGGDDDDASVALEEIEGIVAP